MRSNESGKRNSNVMKHNEDITLLFRMNGTESGFSLLPATSTKICFDKSEFMRDDYKVEQFVSDCRRRVPLEKLRDDLEQVRFIVS